MALLWATGALGKLELVREGGTLDQNTRSVSSSMERKSGLLAFFEEGI